MKILAAYFWGVCKQWKLQKWNILKVQVKQLGISKPYHSQKQTMMRHLSKSIDEDSPVATLRIIVLLEFRWTRGMDRLNKYAIWFPLQRNWLEFFIVSSQISTLIERWSWAKIQGTNTLLTKMTIQTLASYILFI